MMLAKMMSDMPLPIPRWVDELTNPHDEHGARRKRAHDHESDSKNDLGCTSTVEVDTVALEEEQVSDGVEQRQARASSSENTG